MTIVGYESAGGGIDPRTYYLEDDWGDNALSSRSNADAGAWFYQPSASQPGDTLVGRYRPNWTATSGTPAASGGVLVQNDTESVGTDCRIDAGSWECDFTATGSTSGGWYGMWFLAQSESHTPYAYASRAGAGGNYVLDYYNGSTTTLISSTWGDDTATHSMRATREPGGSFELFYDGTSQGTASDTTFTDGDFLVIRQELDTTVETDNLTVN